MRCPTRQENDLERCRDPSTLAERVGIARRCLCHHRRSRRPTQARHQCIRLAHRAQIMHQVHRIAVKHPLRDAVGHRQGEPCALHQSAQIADLGHGQHPRAQPACHLRFSSGKAGAQLVQRLPAEKRRDQQPIGRQGMATLDQLANRIIGPMQGQRMHHQIMRARLQRQHRIIRNHTYAG